MAMPFANMGPTVLATFGALAAVSVESRDPGGYDPSTGRFLQAAAFTAPLECVVLPSQPNEIKQLPENERSTEAITLYALVPLQSSNVALKREADRVVWQGRTFKVVLVENYVPQAGYARMVCTREGE